MRKRFLNVTLAVGLVAGLFAGAIGGVSAEIQDLDGYGPGDPGEAEFIFYPFLPDGQDLGDTGPWYGVATVQNVEDFPVDIVISDYLGGEVLATTTITARATKNFSAASLGRTVESSGAVVQATWDLLIDEDEDSLTFGEIIRGPGEEDEFEDPICEAIPVDEDGDFVPGGPGDEDFDDDFDHFEVECERAPEIAGVQKLMSPSPTASPVTQSGVTLSVDMYTAIPDEDVAWGSASQICAIQTFEEFGFGNDCEGVGEYFAGLPISFFDGHSYAPIVQNNNGWDTWLHVTNVDGSFQQAGVSVVFYMSGSGGVSGPGSLFVAPPAGLDPGETWHLNLTDAFADAGFDQDGLIYSAWIQSDVAVVTSVTRLKESYDMVMQYTAAPSWQAWTSPDEGPEDLIGAVAISENGYEMYAPLVFRAFNGWNTGVSIANISETFGNAIQASWYDSAGELIQSTTVVLNPREMKFIYVPQDAGEGTTGDFSFIGHLVLRSTSDVPFHAVIDEVKYVGNDLDTGHAMNYLATGANASFQAEGQQARLAAPLFQKGAADGATGDTSGIAIINPNNTRSVDALISLYTTGGALAHPTEHGPIVMPLLPNAQGIFYAMSENITPGFWGSAIIEPDGPGEGTGEPAGLVGVSNIVNYGVLADGGSAFNLVNSLGQWRLDCSQVSECPDAPGGGEEDD